MGFNSAFKGLNTMPCVQQVLRLRA